MICQIHLTNVSEQDKEMLDYMFFHPLDKMEEHEGELILNYGGGKVCKGCNDFDEQCTECRYLPYFVREIVKKQDSLAFGKVVDGK